MKTIAALTGALALSSSAALAGGIDRSGQDIGILFEKGGYAELSYGNVNPTVSGDFRGLAKSGNIGKNYSIPTISVKFDISEKFSLAVIMDQPYGAHIKYKLGTFYPLAGTTAELKSQALTVLGRYKIDENFSIHAGIRRQDISGNVFITGGYSLNVSSDAGFGYVLGAAYEIPEIALRAAVTYNSGIDQKLTGTELGAPTEFSSRTPQSVNLDLQSGIAENTLLFGSIRWVNWSDFEIAPPIYTSINGPLVYYPKDTFSYEIGIGRRFTENFSASLAFGYEANQNYLQSNLGPTDGYYSIQLGAEYTINDVTISGGIRYADIGNVTTRVIGGKFKNNSAIGFGLKVGYSF